MSAKRSPTAQRVLAAPSAVPRTLWRSRGAVNALHRLVRLYGLPRDLDANPGGKAVWSTRELEEVALEKIILTDGEMPLCMICDLGMEVKRSNSVLPRKDAVLLCNAHLWVDDSQLLVAGDAEEECMTALALLACTINDLLYPEEIHDNSEFVEEWLEAARCTDGYLRLEALLGYALTDEEDKSYESFIEWLDE